MADIILIEHRGSAWLIRGERYIDDLLVNNLEPSISIDVIACKSESDLQEHWRQEGWDAGQGRTPFMIHPAIVKRIRGTQSGQTVVFGQWSALLDDDALAVLRSIATLAAEATGIGVYLISYGRPNQSRSMTDLTNLRCSLVEEELSRLGVAHSRFAREMRDAVSDEDEMINLERLDIRIGME